MTNQINGAMLHLPNGNQPVFLPTGKPERRFHQRWWTALPAIPSARESHAYHRLWRHFADHTMNPVERKNGFIAPGSTRGFYVEGREDQLVPAFFENFTLLPGFQWLERVLDRLAVARNGGIINAAWSYSYSEVLLKKKQHADIVIMWRDHGGDAVLVIEAKRPACGPNGCGEKDDPANRYYLHYLRMRRIKRRHQALLLDHSDLRRLPERLRSNPAVITWQDLIAIQLDLVNALPIGRSLQELLVQRLNAHFAELGLIVPKQPLSVARPDAAQYAEWRKSEAPHGVKDWLIGSELYFGARHGNALLQPPYDWLADEPTIHDFAREKRQSTADRERPIWHLDDPLYAPA